MKFGKEFKKQMVPEWTDAYMDYDGLKRILSELRSLKRNKQPSTPRGGSQQRSKLYKSFTGLNLQSSESGSQEGDLEDQVIAVNTMKREGSRKVYDTKIVLPSEEGGDVEATFFKKLDDELNKTNLFYKDKVEEVMNEAALLNKQMEALIALRIKVENPSFGDSSLIRRLSSEIASMSASDKDGTPGSLHMDGNLEVEMTNEYQLQESSERESLDSENRMDVNVNYHIEHTTHGEAEKTSGQKPSPLDILDRVKMNNPLDSPISTIRGLLNDSKEEELSFKKEELKKAEDQLKHAFIEFYRKLRLLKNYSFMNLSAFSKIMKKYEKFTSRRAARSYMKIVDDSYLGSSDELTGLMEQVEKTFVNHFAKSNRRAGMKILRPKPKREKHRITFLSGFFSGCTVALLVATVLVIKTRNIMEIEEGTSYMQNIVPLYSLYLYIVLHMLVYAADIYFWRRCRVNYTFIFGFKQGTELGYREMFLLSSGLSVLALASFLANLHMDMDARRREHNYITELVPLGLVTDIIRTTVTRCCDIIQTKFRKHIADPYVIFAITFCPFNIIYRSSRYFLIHCISRCISAPLYKVTLPDFFMGDQLTSQMQAIRSLEYYICYYGWGDFSRKENKCHDRDIYNVFYFIVAVIPYWARFLQCLRRLFEERDAMHGYNGLKYFLTIIAVLIRSAFELRKGIKLKVLALISSAIAALMNTYYDIMVDWGLLQRKSKNFGLRDKLLVSHKSVYFAAMVVNVVLRFAWVQLVLKLQVPSLQGKAASILISCLEILRRGIWNFFRLENEHLNNVGKYRAFKSVPLPFSYCDEDDDDDGSSDSETDKEE